MRTIHVLGGDERAEAAVQVLRHAGRTVLCFSVPGEKDDFCPQEVAEPAVWVLPYPCTEKWNDLLLKLPRGVGGYALAGGMSPAMRSRLEASGFCCYAPDELFLQQNAALTAEIAIVLAQSERKHPLAGENILIVGYGRIGQALSKRLIALGAEVTVSARRREQLQQITDAGMRAEVTGLWHLPLCRYGCIFQTVPFPVFSKEHILLLDKSCDFWELASKPYGVEPDAVPYMAERYHLASGLPGKFAPQTAGQYWAQALLRLLKEKGL